VAAAQQLNNYVGHFLASPLTAGAVVATWDSVAGWPTSGEFSVRVDDPLPATTYEIFKVTAVNVGLAQTTIVRGGASAEGTTAIAHGAGAVGGNELTALMLQTAVAWNAPFYHCEYYANAAQGPILTATNSTINFAQVQNDPAGLFNPATGVLTALKPGRYDVRVACALSAATAGRVILQLNASPGADTLRLADLGAGAATISGTGVIRMNLNDAFTVNLQNISGASITTSAGQSLTWLKAEWIGDL
jgi:hypothetical protein